MCGTCIEPPLHPEGGEKIIKDFGMYPSEFRVDEFNQFTKDITINNEGDTTEGIFAPWFLLKDEYFELIGGHDGIYAPYGYEDSDIFSRMALADFTFIQSRDALVYHFTQRGHKWTKGVGIENTGYREQMEKTRKIYIRKFGTEPIFDYNHKPLPIPKYNIGLVLYNADNHLLEFLEPYFTNVYINNNLPYQYENKVKNINEELSNDIIVEVDTAKLTNENIEFLMKVPFVLKQNTQTGSFQFDIFNIYFCYFFVLFIIRYFITYSLK